MSFKDIIGQEKAVALLQGVLRTGRIATAYLFSGEKGIGKFTTAIEFAKALNCEGPGGEAPCNTCGACLKMKVLRHPDLMVVEPEGGLITVEQIRTIEEFLSFTPYEGRRKIVIVDDADAMNISAENAFLKTLEEPPAGSIIILVSAKEDKLVDTIRSRCLRVRLRTLPRNDMLAVAQKIDRGDIGDDRIRLAMGRVGQLIDDEMIEKRNSAFAVLRETLSGKELAAPKDRESIEELLDQCIVLFRDMAVYLSTGKERDLLNKDISSDIAGMCKESDINTIIHIYNLLSDLRRRTAYNLNKALVMNYLSSLLVMMNKKTAGN